MQKLWFIPFPKPNKARNQIGVKRRKHFTLSLVLLHEAFPIRLAITIVNTLFKPLLGHSSMWKTILHSRYTATCGHFKYYYNESNTPLP